MSHEVQRFGKAHAMYPTFERKGPGEVSTHYCPGCGHGTIQKIIAEAIDDLGIQDRTIMLSPVGCAVFSYYYFDTGNIQCSHGRAPAVATGVKRTVRDAVVISYQGDGDLAGIGMTEIMHAANRGEPITVFFVNNAIYGMTGGQMAPTTLLGQKTLTSPYGRSSDRDGNPIGMAEVMHALKAPVFIARCAVSSPRQIMQTRKAVHTALKNQMDGAGFAFVEILSPCPTNWRMSPVASRPWIEQTMVKDFPLGTICDEAKERLSITHTAVPSPLDDEALLRLLEGDSAVREERTDPFTRTQLIKVAGFGGQGVLSAGELLATCAMIEQLEVAWLPSYGPEMRGGSANVSVTISEEEIGSPVIDHPNVLLAMNGPSLELFEPLMEEQALVIVNSSIVSHRVKRTDLRVLYIDATDIARNAQVPSGANVVMVCAYLLASQVMPLEVVKQAIPLVLRKKEFLEKNLYLVEHTREYIEKMK